MLVLCSSFWVWLLAGGFHGVGLGTGALLHDVCGVVLSEGGHGVAELHGLLGGGHGGECLFFVQLETACTLWVPGHHNAG